MEDDWSVFIPFFWAVTETFLFDTNIYRTQTAIQLRESSLIYSDLKRGMLVLWSKILRKQLILMGNTSIIFYFSSTYYYKTRVQPMDPIVLYS